MSIFYQPVAIVSRTGASSEEVEALVDTGSVYLWVPGSVLRRLGYEPVETRRFATATGEEIERGVGPAVVRLDGRTLPVFATFGDEGSTPLLGAVVLEIFGLAVDTINHRLVPVTLPLASVPARHSTPALPPADAPRRSCRTP